MDEITAYSPSPVMTDERHEEPKDCLKSEKRSNTLPLSQRLGFSVGHFLNDLCSAVWFTYLLVYLQYVRQLSGQMAGLALLVGQVADALATPFVGLESDRETHWSFCLSYGKRKTWHVFGTICVIFSFPMIFIQCVGCNEYTHPLSQLLYYSAFIVIFQFGWASVQISQLSLIPDLTPLSHERLQLNSWVYAWTVTANIAVYSVTWILLGQENEGGSGLSSSSDVLSPDSGQPKISPSDANKFRDLVLIVVGIGALFSAIFHLVVKEKQRESPSERDKTPVSGIRRRTISVTSIDYTLTCNHLRWHHWFTVSQFYKIGLLYTGTRLCINLTQAYIPFYLQESLNLHPQSIAYIPLSMYLSGFLSSFLMKYINTKIGKKWTYLLGGVIAIGGFLCLFFGRASDPFFSKYGIYLVSAAMGVSGSTMLITSLGITNDLIGHNTSSGAFVFGAMSFLDKLSNGLAVMIIQTVHDKSLGSVTRCNFYRNVLVFVCGGATCMALLALGFLSRDTIGAKRSNTHQRLQEENDDDDHPEEGITRTTRHDQIQPQLIVNENREETLVSPVVLT